MYVNKITIYLCKSFELCVEKIEFSTGKWKSHASHKVEKVLIPTQLINDQINELLMVINVYLSV